eukprot:6475473-Prymnesium_polylepis.1
MSADVIVLSSDDDDGPTLAERLAQRGVKSSLIAQRPKGKQPAKRKAAADSSDDEVEGDATSDTRAVAGQQRKPKASGRQRKQAVRDSDSDEDEDDVEPARPKSKGKRKKADPASDSEGAYDENNENRGQSV